MIILPFRMHTTTNKIWLFRKYKYEHTFFIYLMSVNHLDSFGFFCLFWSLSGVILSAERSERAERIKTLLFYAQRAVILTWNAILQCACCLAVFLKEKLDFSGCKECVLSSTSVKFTTKMIFWRFFAELWSHCTIAHCPKVAANSFFIEI